MTLPELPDVPKKNEGEGCGFIALFILAVIWVAGLTLFTLFVNWTVEQALEESLFNVTDFRWITLLVFSLAIAIPMAILGIKAGKPRPRHVYWTWFGAAIFALFMVPTRLVSLTDAQTINFIQIGMLCLFDAGYWLFTYLRVRNEKKLSNEPINGWGIAILIGAGIGLPWAIWGAMGSALDTTLNLAVGLLAGVAAALIYRDSLLQFSQHPDRDYRPADFIMDGLVGAVMLVIMMTALGVTNYATLLVVAVPVMSWLAAGVNLFNRKSASPFAWLPMACVLGLAIAFPLIMVDGDELALVFNGGAGELLSWAFRADWVTAALGLVMGIVTLWNMRTFQADQPPSRIQVGLAVAGLMIWTAVWHFGGQSGFYGERLFVILNEKADVQSLESLPYPDRRDAVYKTLVETANESQAGLREKLDARGLTYTPYYLVNAIEVKGDIFTRWWLEKQPEVDRVLASPHLRPLPQPVTVVPGTITREPEETPWNLVMIGADKVHSELGITGAGILVGQADSGVDGNHPELADSWRGRDGTLDGNWLDPWNASIRPVDISGHGTHTLGIILGNNVGVAPDADWIGCTNLARNQGNPGFYLTCMQFLFAPYGQSENPFTDGQPLSGAEVFNNSWGCPESEGCDNYVMSDAALALRTAGVYVAVSAGNSGFSGCGSISEPLAIFEDVFSVGAVDSMGQIAEFSSLGPVVVDGSNRLKPDLAAPGVDILSAYPQGAYEVFSGTSMAGPHVAGTVALMWSANPDLIGQIDLTDKILRETARPYEGILPECVGQSLPNEAVGYGILDAYAAVKQALEIR